MIQTREKREKPQFYTISSFVNDASGIGSRYLLVQLTDKYDKKEIFLFAQAVGDNEQMLEIVKAIISNITIRGGEKLELKIEILSSGVLTSDRLNIYISMDGEPNMDMAKKIIMELSFMETHWSKSVYIRLIPGA